MGLKGYRLWAMGQLDSNVQSPTEGARGAHPQRDGQSREEAPRCSGTSRNSRKPTLKPVAHFIGSSVETRLLFQAMGQLD
jgi:hypothetical protein